MQYPILKPNSTWFSPTVSTITRSTITTINIVDSYTPTTTPTDSWDASVAQDGSIMCYVDDTVLTIAGNGSGCISANLDSSYMFSDVNKKDYFSVVTKINGLSILDMSLSTTTYFMFGYCQEVSYLDISNWNTKNVADFYGMFNYCTKIVSFDLSRWDTSSLTRAKGMFNHCHSLITVDLTNFIQSTCNDIGTMFQMCYELYSVNTTGWDTSNCTNFSYMFNNCPKLEILDVSNWDTSSCINMYVMFYKCHSLKTLNFSNWDTSLCTNMDRMLNMNRLEIIKIGKKFNFYGNNITNGNHATLPSPSSEYISGANGNWYTCNLTSYTTKTIPNLTENTYYASKELAKKAFIELNGKKYVSLNSLSMFHDLQNVEIDTKINTLREERGNIEEITNDEIQALFGVNV